MRASAKRWLSLLAAYALAVQAVFGAIAMPQAQAAADPFTVICHAVTQDSDAGINGAPQGTPSQCCDHCVLCQAAPAADNAAQPSTAVQRRAIEIALPWPVSTRPFTPPPPLRYLPQGPPPTA